MFNFRLIIMEYRVVVRSMDRYRRYFSIRFFNVCFFGILCRIFRLYFVVTFVLFLASNSYFLSRSLLWNF